MPNANLFDPHWDAEQDRPPFTFRRSRLGRQAGADKLGASLVEVPPGSSAFPLHVHYANEEMIFVIEGSFTLKTLDGERTVNKGDVIACPAGPEGAHRLHNHGDAPAQFLVVSTMIAPDITDYPESNKVWARSYAPGAAKGDDDYDVLVAKTDQLDYLHGEK
jgi:uncharacterized cupin superfamily protein